VPASVYRSQKRGGKGVSAMTTREEDYADTVFTASTHDYLLFFTNTGKVHRKKGYMIPEAGRTAKGTNIINILPVDPGERVTAMLHIRELNADRFLFMITRNGTVKRISADSLKNIRSVGIRALHLDEGDELIAVRDTDGEQNILLATNAGMAICFNENDVRVMGRDATGVRGIRLREGDFVVGAGELSEGTELLTLTENGYGKRTPVEEYMRGDDNQPQRRGGSGLKNYNITAKTGKAVAAEIVRDDEDILVMSSDGDMIRMPVSGVNIYGRLTQGVRIMNVPDGVTVISMARTDKEEDEGVSEARESGTEQPVVPDAE